jgi:hypothetical protein
VIGLFGAFDTGDLGEVALRRVIESELGRLRPDVDLVTYAPLGAERPIPGDEGRPARPLVPVASAATLGVDALIIAGDVLLDDEGWGARYGTPAETMADRGVATLALTGRRGGQAAAASLIWFAVTSAAGEADVSGIDAGAIWARDLATQKHVGGTAAQSGDPLLLAGRLFSPEVLRRRADLLRLCGALPAGRRLVVETAPGLGASHVIEGLIEAVSAALRGDPRLSAVVVDLDPTRQPSAGSRLQLPGLSAERVHHLPDWVGLDDIAAVMSGSVAVLAISPEGAHLAASLSTPVSALDTGLGERFDAAIPLLDGDLTPAVLSILAAPHTVAIDRAREQLDGAFAELAERLPHRADSVHVASQADATESALAILQRRLADERTALSAELSRLQAELDHLRASPEHRLARPIREGYQRWQRRRT